MVVYGNNPLKAFSFNKLLERTKFGKRKKEKWTKIKENG